MTPIHWSGQVQMLAPARIDPRPDRPAFFAEGMRSHHHGRTLGWPEPVGDGFPRVVLGQSIGGDTLHRALDA
jgi:hypothetical protein